MTFLKNTLSFIIASIAVVMVFNVDAQEHIAKEEVTPPPSDGALTAKHIPPVFGAERNANRAAANLDQKQQ